MIFISLMTAVISVVSPFSIPVPFSPVPLSLTTLILYLSTYILGLKYSLYSTALYLLLGAIGLPVFSGFSGGFGKLLGPTGGYLAGYLLIPLFMGFFIRKTGRNKFFSTCYIFIGMLMGTCACYLTGTLWLSLQTEQSFLASLTIGILPFIPGDLCKITLALFLAPQIKKRLTNSGFPVSSNH